MTTDDMTYHLGVGFEVKIAKWRIDDQSIPENQEWSLWVFDRNKEMWIPAHELNRPGEGVVLRGVFNIEE